MFFQVWVTNWDHPPHFLRLHAALYMHMASGLPRDTLKLLRLFKASWLSYSLYLPFTFLAGLLLVPTCIAAWVSWDIDLPLLFATRCCLFWQWPWMWVSSKEHQTRWALPDSCRHKLKHHTPHSHYEYSVGGGVGYFFNVVCFQLISSVMKCTFLLIWAFFF